MTYHLQGDLQGYRKEIKHGDSLEPSESLIYVCIAALFLNYLALKSNFSRSFLATHGSLLIPTEALNDVKSY